LARRINRDNLPSRLKDEVLANMVLRTFGSSRWTQDSPIVPDVWIKYVQAEWVAAYRRIVGGEKKPPLPEVDLLLTPWTGSIPGMIARRIRVTLERPTVNVAPSSSRVAAELTFAEMFTAVLPLTGWWQGWFKKLSDRFIEGQRAAFRRNAPKGQTEADFVPEPFGLSDLIYKPAWWLADKEEQKGAARRELMYLDWLRLEALVGFIVLIMEAETEADLGRILDILPHMGSSRPAPGDDSDGYVTLATEQSTALVDAFGRMLLSTPPRLRKKAEEFGEQGDDLTMSVSDPLSERIWMVNLNRTASTTMFDSRKTVKADAAQRVFDTNGRGVTVAVLDLGIQATHPGFFDRKSQRVKDRIAEKQKEADAAGEDLDELTVFEPIDLPWSSRVRATYDFTLLRELMSGTANNTLEPKQITEGRTTLAPAEIELALKHLTIRAASGRGIDWALIEPLIRIPHTQHYGERQISGDHGTHVAGIVAADLPNPPEYDRAIQGVCPEATLYDMRVFDQSGESDEYAILAAIEFVGWLNRNRNEPVIHAVNLSLALAHDVDSFACGRTPICDACNQLVGAGTVVVAAAGNTGFENVEKKSIGNGFRTVSITDPGNADDVITVGSTHRRDPHAYGVSYFSSRGPTADGRRKPDLLAPGEKINSTVFDGQVKPLDGTSMAAPHVTGAAALLMARYPELIGQPRKIKQVLMESATDLGRERSFQGAGLLDILRALQSI